MFLLLLAPAQAQTLDLPVKVQESTSKLDFRFANDSWFTNDKLDHLAGGMVTMSITTLLWQPHTESDVWQRAGINALAWILYEAKDGWISWTPERTFGGDGFSVKDATWSIVGVGLITAVVFTVR